MKRKILALSSILIAVALLVSPVLALTQVSNDPGLDDVTAWWLYEGYGSGSHRAYIYQSMAMTEYKTTDSSFGATSYKQNCDLWGGPYGSSWSLGYVLATTTNLQLDYSVTLSWTPTIRSGGAANAYVDIWCAYSQQSGGYSYAELTIYLCRQGDGSDNVGSYSHVIHTNQGSPQRTYYQEGYHACQANVGSLTSGSVNLNAVLAHLVTDTGCNLSYIYIVGMEFGVEAKNADVNAQFGTISFHY